MCRLRLLLIGLFLGCGFPATSTGDNESEGKKAESEGRPCFIKKTGAAGLCTNIDHCEYAKSLLKRKNWKKPETCSNEIVNGIYPIVCCPATRSQVVCSIYNPPNDACLVPAISGGEPSLAKEFPHMAALGYGEEKNIKWFCGGTLISSQFVLTAAHCIKTTEYGDVRFVRLGDLDLESTEDENRRDSDPQDFTVAEAFVHEKYRPKQQYHDIALVKLDRTARFSLYVYPACLHTELPAPNEMIVSGYGTVDLYGSTSSHLLKANLFYVNHTTCASRYSTVQKRQLPNGIVNDIQICAGHPKGKDTCPGDSGGPLQYRVYEGNPHYRVVGVTSFGQGCGIGNTIAVYTRVSSYLGWIEDIVWPAATFSTTQI